MTIKFIAVVDPDAKILHFPSKTTADRVEIEHPFKESLTAFTVTCWVQVDPLPTYHAVISYSVENGADNELLIYFTSSRIKVMFKDSHIG